MRNCWVSSEHYFRVKHINLLGWWGKLRGANFRWADLVQGSERVRRGSLLNYKARLLRNRCQTEAGTAASSFENDPGILSTYRARRVARMRVSMNDRSSSIPNIGGSE